MCSWSNIINEYYRDFERRGLIYRTDIATYSMLRVIDTFSWRLPISRSDRDRRSHGPFAEHDRPECKPDPIVAANRFSARDTPASSSPRFYLCIW